MVEDGRRVQAAKPDQEQTAWGPGLTIRQSKCVHVGAASAFAHRSLSVAAPTEMLANRRRLMSAN